MGKNGREPRKDTETSQPTGGHAPHRLRPSSSSLKLVPCSSVPSVVPLLRRWHVTLGKSLHVGSSNKTLRNTAATDQTRTEYSSPLSASRHPSFSSSVPSAKSVVNLLASFCFQISRALKPKRDDTTSLSERTKPPMPRTIARPRTVRWTADRDRRSASPRSLRHSEVACGMERSRGASDCRMPRRLALHAAERGLELGPAW